MLRGKSGDKVKGDGRSRNGVEGGWKVEEGFACEFKVVQEDVNGYKVECR
jgi:hypothetical protein